MFEGLSWHKLDKLIGSSEQTGPCTGPSEVTIAVWMKRPTYGLVLYERTPRNRDWRKSVDLLHPGAPNPLKFSSAQFQRRTKNNNPIPIRTTIPEGLSSPPWIWTGIQIIWLIEGLLWVPSPATARVMLTRDSGEDCLYSGNPTEKLPVKGGFWLHHCTSLGGTF